MDPGCILQHCDGCSFGLQLPETAAGTWGREARTYKGKGSKQERKLQSEKKQFLQPCIWKLVTSTQNKCTVDLRIPRACLSRILLMKELDSDLEGAAGYCLSTLETKTLFGDTSRDWGRGGN